MAMMSLQLLAPILGLPARNGCTGRRLRVAVVSCKHNQERRKTMKTCMNCSLFLILAVYHSLMQSTDVQGANVTSRISRRDALSYVSSAFLLATFLVTDRAEARTSRQDNKRKVMEKLDKIREKALGPKEKDGGAGEEKGRVANLLIPPALVDAYI